MIDLKKLKKYRGRKAVSPVVATLILIIVAIVGAVAVGLIVSGIGSQTSKNANVGNVQSQAQTQILIGGSTTAYPAVEAAATAYGAANGLNIQVQQGGGGAGMTGVAEGVLNIGVAGSLSNVVSAISEYPSANLQAFEVGGSADVFIANLPTATYGTCYGITQGALEELYDNGTLYLTAQCTTTHPWSEIIGTGNITTTSPGVGALYAVSRSDLPSGAEDTACTYLNSGKATNKPCAATSNNKQPLAGLTEAGDSGILAEVQAKSGAVGFVAIGYAEGSVTTAGSTTAVVQIEETWSTSVDNTTDILPATTSGSFNSYALTGQTTVSLDNFIKASLSNTSPSATSEVYPDATSGTGLTRTFWLVTAGAPAADEQAFINYVRSPAAQSFWNNAGIYSIYQLTPITPP